MATAEQRNRARAFLEKAEQYLASAEDNLQQSRPTPAAGDSIHAGISAKDAIVTALTGSTSKGRDHATAASELGRVLAGRHEASSAEKALGELMGAKAEVEHGTRLITLEKAEPLVRRARILVDLAVQIARLGR